MNLLADLPDGDELSEQALAIGPELRVNLNVEGWIDAGYIHQRAIYTLFESRKVYQRLAPMLKEEEMRPWYASKGSYTGLLLAICRRESAPNLSVLAIREAPVQTNTLVCSVDRFKGVRFTKRTEEKVLAPWVPYGPKKKDVYLRFNPQYALADTTRSELRAGALHAHISLVKENTESAIIIEPLLLGGPWLTSEDENLANELLFSHLPYFEIFVDDVDEFALVREVPKPAPNVWQEAMKCVSEEKFKSFICGLLNEVVAKDWGGEMSDVFAGHLHLRGRRETAAFVLKGPSKFSPMTSRHLGKNGDQIERLAQEPASVLIVQHCHEVTSAIRSRLRAAANQLYTPRRRFMVMDGADSYRLLSAYGFFK